MPVVFLFRWPNTLASQSSRNFQRLNCWEKETSVQKLCHVGSLFLCVFFVALPQKQNAFSSLALLWQDDNFWLASDVCMMAVDCRSALFQVQSCIEHFGTDFEISWFTWDTLHVWPLNQRFYHIPSQALLKIKHCKWIAPLSLFLHRVRYHFFHGATIAILLSSSKWFNNKKLDAWNTKQGGRWASQSEEKYALQNGLKVKIRKKYLKSSPSLWLWLVLRIGFTQILPFLLQLLFFKRPKIVQPKMFCWGYSCNSWNPPPMAKWIACNKSEQAQRVL